MYDEYCTISALSTAFKNAIADIKLKVKEEDVQQILSESVFNKMSVAIYPKQFDMKFLPNVPIIDHGDECRGKHRAFLLRVLSDDVEYIEKIGLEKFLLADKNFLDSGDWHCMAILNRYDDIYFCQTNTMKGDAKVHEKIKASRPSIDLHKLSVSIYLEAMEAHRIRSHSSHCKDNRPRVNVHQVNPWTSAQATGLCKENDFRKKETTRAIIEAPKINNTNPGQNAAEQQGCRLPKFPGRAADFEAGNIMYNS